LNWFYELYLNPGTSFWRYLLRTSAATFALAIPISYVLAFALPNLYPVNFDPGLSRAGALQNTLLFYGLFGPALFVGLAFFVTRNLRPRTDNAYIVAAIITAIASLICAAMAGFGMAAATAWPIFAGSLAFQVGLKTSAGFAALAGGGVLSIYNLAGLGLYVLSA